MEAGANVVKPVNIAVRSSNTFIPGFVLGEDIVIIITFAGVEKAVDGEDYPLGAVLVNKCFT